MYGRDKDSYASVVGALAGAFHGIDSIPLDWIQPVTDANQEVDMHDYALQITRLIVGDYQTVRTNLNDLAALL